MLVIFILQRQADLILQRHIRFISGLLPSSSVSEPHSTSESHSSTVSQSSSIEMKGDKHKLSEGIY